MSELRYDPLEGRWIIVAPDRARRPDFYAAAQKSEEGRTPCPFCPGNESVTAAEILALRNGSGPNQPGWQVRVCPNRYPVLSVEASTRRRAEGFYDVLDGVGAHEIVIEGPQHDLDLCDYDLTHITSVLSCVQSRLCDLYQDLRLKQLLAFKNRGQGAGASVRHAHSQLVATPVVQARVRQRLQSMREHFRDKKRSLLGDLVSQELKEGDRIIRNSDGLVTYVPFAAAHAFEMLIVPRDGQGWFSEAPEEMLTALAASLKDAVLRLRGTLGEVAYNLALYVEPNTRSASRLPNAWASLREDFCWHLSLVPRLHPWGGLEWGGGQWVTSVAPEEAAEHFRQAPCP